MSAKTPWPLNEAAYYFPEWLLYLAQAVLVIVLAAQAVMTREIIIRVLMIFYIIVVCCVAALFKWLKRHYRVVIDENGAAIGPKHMLKWTQIRTAAVIQRGNPALNSLRRFKGEYHFILLSVQEPKKAIDKWTFRLEAAKPGREVRIPYTDKRREAVEHYLHMELPTIRL